MRKIEDEKGFGNPNNIRFHNKEESLEITHEIKGFIKNHGYSFSEYTYLDIDQIIDDILYLNHDLNQIIHFLGLKA